MKKLTSALLSLLLLVGVCPTLAEEPRADIAYTTDLVRMKNDIANTKYRLTLLETANFVPKSVTDAISARVDVIDGKLVVVSDELEKCILATDATNLVLQLVPEWSRAATKPTYDYSEIENVPDLHDLVTTQEATNIVITIVPDWSRLPTKPSYTYTEILNAPDVSVFITESAANERFATWTAVNTLTELLQDHTHNSITTADGTVGGPETKVVVGDGFAEIQYKGPWLPTDSGPVQEAWSKRVATVDQLDGFVDKTITNGLASQAWVDERGFVDETVTNGLASTSWVNAQEFVKENVTNGLASMGWVDSKNFVTETVTNGLASRDWVMERGFVDESVTNGLAAKTWVNEQGFVKEEVTNGLASVAWVNAQEYVNKSVTNGLAGKTDIPTKVSELTNDSNFVTQAITNGLASTNWVLDTAIVGKMDKVVATVDHIATFDDEGNAVDSGVSINTVAKAGHVHDSITTDNLGLIGGVGATLSISNNGIASVTWHPGTSTPNPANPPWTKVIAFTNDIPTDYVSIETFDTVLASYATKAELPGDYETVSNRAMNAATPVDVYSAALDATNYTDSAISEIMDDFVIRQSNGAVDLGRRLDPSIIGNYSIAEGHNTTARGEYSHAEGSDTVAYGSYSHSEGVSTVARGGYAHAEGHSTTARGTYSHADGFRAVTAEFGSGTSASNPHLLAYCWQGHTNVTDSVSDFPYYHSHGNGTFNINPVGGPAGFWIGEENLATLFGSKVSKSGDTMTGQLDLGTYGLYQRSNDIPPLYQWLYAGSIFINASGDTSHPPEYNLVFPLKSGVFAMLGDLAPAYDPSRAYAVGEIAAVDGVLKRCTTAGTGSAAVFTAATVEDALSAKQDKISDLDEIRAGAEGGATAVQPSALSAYRPAAAQDAIDDGKASTADATLVPNEFGDWNVVAQGTPSTITLRWGTVNGVSGWIPDYYGSDAGIPKGDESSTSLSWSASTSPPEAAFNITATRSVTSYRLGSQTDKPLAPAGDYATTNQLALESTTRRDADIKKLGRNEVASTFSNQASYKVGELVVYSDALYRCTEPHSGAWDATHFASATVQEALDDRLSLAADAIAPIWQQGTYTNGDFVIHDRHLYECTNATSGAWAAGAWRQTSLAEMLGNIRSVLHAINGD